MVAFVETSTEPLRSRLPSIVVPFNVVVLSTLSVPSICVLPLDAVTLNLFPPDEPTLKLPSTPAVPSTSKVPSIWVLPVAAVTLNLLEPTLKFPSTPSVLFNSVVP